VRKASDLKLTYYEVKSNLFDHQFFGVRQLGLVHFRFDLQVQALDLRWLRYIDLLALRLMAQCA
jgi:hypothetical protein